MRKMESEGPYKCAAVAEGIDGIVYRIYGPGVETLGADFSQERGARIVAVVANSAYAEGRKSMEKDFRELLEMMKYVVDRIGDSGPFGQMHALEKLMAWKKERGIE